MRKHLTLIFLSLCFLCHARNTNVLYNAVFDSLYIEGVCYRNSDSIDLALERFTQCEKVDAQNAALSFELSKVYTTKQDSAQALDYLKKAYTLDSNNYFYAISLAEFYDDAKDYGQAIKIYEKIYKSFPEKKNILYLLARSYALNNQLNKSIQVLDKLENRIGQNKMISMEKSRLYIYQDKYKKAIKELDKAIKKYPLDAELYVFRGNIMMETGQKQEAVADFEKALELNPNAPGAQISLCAYYSETYDMQKMEYYLQKILANENIDIPNKKRYIEFALNFYQNNPEQIDKVFDTVIKASPESTEALLMYANVLQQLNNLPKAIEVLHSAVLLDEKCLTCWQELVATRISAKSDDNILGEKEIINQALNNFPNDPYLLFVEGGFFVSEGETLKAFESLKKSLDGVDPKSKIAESIYQMMSEMPLREALLIARDGIMLFPKNLMLLNNYAYNVAVCWGHVRDEKPAEELAEFKKILDEAEKISETTVKADAINPFYLDTYAYILFLQGKYELAKFYTEQAMHYDKEGNFEILEHYGDILNAIGEKELAIKYWQAAYLIQQTESLSNKINQYEK